MERNRRVHSRGQARPGLAQANYAYEALNLNSSCRAEQLVSASDSRSA